MSNCIFAVIGLAEVFAGVYYSNIVLFIIGFGLILLTCWNSILRNS